jgi:carbonic anhydrase
MGGQTPAKQAWIPVLEKLMEGNRRYAAGKARHPHCDAPRRMELRGGQRPFAVILGCSDSRIPPELIFDQGLGDLFVVRLAGAVVGELGLATIEFAVMQLETPVVMVLGHADCGAITAATASDDQQGHLPHVIRILRPAVEAVRGKPGNLVGNAARACAMMQAQRLRQAEPILAELVQAEKVKVFAAYFDIDSGVVEIL